LGQGPRRGQARQTDADDDDSEMFYVHDVGLSLSRSYAPGL
jgi:hypothetical protein